MTIAFGRRLLDLLRHRLDDAGVGVQQVVARHARLARDAGRDDDDVGAGRLLVAVRADDARVEALDRRGLPLVEPLALRNALGDVDHDDGARQLLLGDALRGRRADVAGADDRDLIDHECDSLKVKLPVHSKVSRSQWSMLSPDLRERAQPADAALRAARAPRGFSASARRTNGVERQSRAERRRADPPRGRRTGRCAGGRRR